MTNVCFDGKQGPEVFTKQDTYPSSHYLHHGRPTMDRHCNSSPGTPSMLMKYQFESMYHILNMAIEERNNVKQLFRENTNQIRFTKLNFWIYKEQFRKAMIL